MQSFSSPPLPREPGERRRPARALLAPAAGSKRPGEGGARLGLRPAGWGGCAGGPSAEHSPRAARRAPCPRSALGGRHLPGRSSQPGPARRSERSGPPRPPRFRPVSLRVSRGGGHFGGETRRATSEAGSRQAELSRFGPRARGFLHTYLLPRREARASPWLRGAAAAAAACLLPPSLPSPHSLALARAPTPHSARALPRPRAPLSARSRGGVPSGPAHARWAQPAGGPEGLAGMQHGLRRRRLRLSCLDDCSPFALQVLSPGRPTALVELPPWSGPC